MGYKGKRFLDDDCFKVIISNTPLVSIDLVVRNSAGQILLGKRLNPPALSFWFVPGGRIYKNESLGSAFKRITLEELGVKLDITSAKYLGLYEHFYSDSIFSNEALGENISTHYVVNAFEIIIPFEDVKLPLDQHDAFRWLTEGELMVSSEVHVHSKWYFDRDKGFLS